MNFIIFGAGFMSQAIVKDLCKINDFHRIKIVDRNKHKLRKIAQLACKPVITKQADISTLSIEELAELMEDYDVAIGTVGSELYLQLTKAAIQAGVNYCDFGGNDMVFEDQLKLNADAKEKGVVIIPDCGATPGLTTILAYSAINYLDNAEQAIIRVGAIPANPQPPLNYSILFDISGVIDEYIYPSYKIEAGKIKEVLPLGDPETLTVDLPDRGEVELEACCTADMLSDMVHMLEGKINTLNLKVIRWPGHNQLMKSLYDLGILQDLQELEVKPGCHVSPREFIEAWLNKTIGRTKEDIAILRIIVTGTKEKQTHTISYKMTEYSDEDLTATMKIAAIPTSIIAQKLAHEQRDDIGVTPAYEYITDQYMIDEMAKREIYIQKKMN